MASAYIEISVKEEVASYCSLRSNTIISEFVRSTIERENSLNCKKIENLLASFDSRIWDHLKAAMTPEETAAIDSLKALRDQIAHGRDNNTGYVVISRYFEAVISFPEKLSEALAKL